MAGNLLPLRLPDGASPGRSRVRPGPPRPLRRSFARAPPCARPTACASARPSAPEPAGGGPLPGDSPASLGRRRTPVSLDVGFFRASFPRAHAHHGNNEDVSFSRPADLDLIQSTPFKPLALKTPPRVLTLSERPLDFLDLERPLPTPQNEEIRAVGRLKRERSMSENAVRQNGQLVRNDSMWHRSDSAPRNKISRFQASISTPEYTVTPSPPQARVCPPHMLPEDGANLSSARGILSLIQSSTRRAYQQILDVLDENRSVRRQNEIRCERPVLRGGSAAATSNPHHDNVRHGVPSIDAAIEGASDDVTVVDAASLRRQIIKLNRRLQLLEEENKERAKREMVMYSITVAFWLLNSWLWFRR
nr:mitochondrial fission factor [Meriones unguiculatus]